MRLTKVRVTPKPLGDTCEMCGAVKQDRRRGQWWQLSGYRKLFWGLFCPDCFEVISLDGTGAPRHPEAPELALERVTYRGVYKLFQQRAEKEEEAYQRKVFWRRIKPPEFIT